MRGRETVPAYLARRWRLVLLLVLLCSCLVLLHAGARRYASALVSQLLPALPESEVCGKAHYDAGEGDAAVVVDDLVVGESGGSYDAVDWSWAWRDAVQRWVGYSAAIRPQHLDRELQRRRILVLTRSTAASTPPGLGPWVEQGGVLVVQAPCSQLALGGVRLAGEPAWAEKITRVSEECLPLSACARMIRIPIHARRWTAEASTEARPLLWLDDQPAAWLTRVGKGAVVSVAFDMAAALVAWQQGVPNADFTVSEKYGAIPFIVEADDLAMDPAMLHNQVPCADLLVRAIIGSACDAGRIPSLWPIPNGAPAALIVTHDDEAQGPIRFAPLLGEDRRRGFEPTVFISANGIEAEAWASTDRADRQLHWNRHLMADGQRRTLSDQWFPSARISRIHYLDWGHRWETPWSKTAAAGLHADASLGANAGCGYVFGSGLPYGVLDATGRPLGLLEFPFEFQEDWGGGGEEAMRKLLDLAILEDHSAVVTLTHLDKWMKTKEGQDAFDHLAERAHAAGVWSGSMASFLDARHLAILEPLPSRRDGRRVDVCGYGWYRVPDPSHYIADGDSRRLSDGTVLVHVDNKKTLIYDR